MRGRRGIARRRCRRDEPVAGARRDQRSAGPRRGGDKACRPGGRRGPGRTAMPGSAPRSRAAGRRDASRERLPDQVAHEGLDPPHELRQADLLPPHARELGLPLAGEGGALHGGGDEVDEPDAGVGGRQGLALPLGVAAPQQRLDDLGAGGGSAEAALLHGLRQLAVVEGGPGPLHGRQQRRVGEAAGRPRLLLATASTPATRFGWPAARPGGRSSAGSPSSSRASPPGAGRAGREGGGSRTFQPACCTAVPELAKRSTAGAGWPLATRVTTVVTAKTCSSCHAMSRRRHTRS